MSTDFDAATPSPAAVLPALQYFPDHDGGWNAIARLTLLFAILHSATRLLGALSWLSYLAAPLAGGRIAGSYAIGLAPTVTAQLLLPIATVTACVLALNQRSRGIRLWIVWCHVLSIAWSLFSAFSQLMLLTGTAVSRSAGPSVRILSVTSTLLSQLDMALLPALVIVVLTRADVRPHFDQSQSA